MELKDPNLQREIIPENVFKPGSGLQKLEKLPEESQKHLRNQLREIIVQGDPWQPGDEEINFPYTPSVAASTDPSLAKQELEAWGELVDSYHQRESQIYENSSGIRAAMGSEQGSSDSQENNAGPSGQTGQGDEGSQGQQSGQENNPNQNGNEGTYSVNTPNDPDAANTAGVSQNAMEFLKGHAKGGSATGESNSEDFTMENTGDPKSMSKAGTSQNAMEFLKGTVGSEDLKGESQAGGQEALKLHAQGDGKSENTNDSQSPGGQQVEPEQKPAPVSPPASASTVPVSSAQTDEMSSVGASQNALEYLKQEADQSGETALTQPGDGQTQDTLTIQDLLNARGVGESAEPHPDPTQAKKNQAKEADKLKDGNDQDVND